MTITRIRGLWAALLLGLTTGLAGCGITYVSPTVSGQASGVDVRVVPLTRETVLLANRAPYAPRSLPDYFRQGAGFGDLRGAGALPSPPVLPDLRPGQLDFRPPPPARNGAYRIGQGDVIRLATRGTTTSGLTDLGVEQDTGSVLQQYTVRDDGTIGVPTIGTVEIAGMTIDEAEARLFQRFIEAGLDPSFSAEIAEYRAARIAVGGEVGSPVVIPVTLNIPTLDEALIAAGGIQVATPEYAAIRLYREGTLYQIPLAVYAQRADLRSAILQAGDSVFVDSTYDLDRALAYFQQQIELSGLRRSARTTALAELSSEIALRRAALSEQRELFGARSELGAEARDYVYLAGEVAQQSRFTLPYEQQATLADVLYGSGGFDVTTGNPAQIYILRASDNPAEFGAVTAWHLNAANAANLTLAADIQMRPDDIVFIEEQPITRWNRALQQFFPTLINAAAGAI